MPRLLTRPTLAPLDAPSTLDRAAPHAVGLAGLIAPMVLPGGSRLTELVRGAVFTSTNTPVWGSSPLGIGLTYAKGSSQMTTGTIPHGIGTGDFALVAWIAVRSVTDDWNGFLRFGSGGGPSIYLGRSGAQVLSLYDGGTQDATVAFTVGVPVHIAVVRRGTTIYFYKDGVEDATTRTSAINVSSNVVEIARSDGADHGSFTLHELRIYNRSLSTQEIWQLWAPQTRWSVYRPAKWRTLAQSAGEPGVSSGASIRRRGFSLFGRLGL